LAKICAGVIATGVVVFVIAYILQREGIIDKISGLSKESLATLIGVGAMVVVVTGLLITALAERREQRIATATRVDEEIKEYYNNTTVSEVQTDAPELQAPVEDAFLKELKVKIGETKPEAPVQTATSQGEVAKVVAEEDNWGLDYEGSDTTQRKTQPAAIVQQTVADIKTGTLPEIPLDQMQAAINYRLSRFTTGLKLFTGFAATGLTVALAVYALQYYGVVNQIHGVSKQTLALLSGIGAMVAASILSLVVVAAMEVAKRRKQTKAATAER
jgi:DNA repair protein RadC